VALMVIPYSLVAVLFERGAFTATDTAATALAVAVYGLGLPAFVLQKALQPLFFAREDTRRPFNYALVALVLNLVLALGLTPFIGFIAAALGTTLTGWAMVLLLWNGSRSMGVAATLDDRFKARIWRICAASAGMGAVLWVAQLLLGPTLGMAGLRYIALTALVGIGVVSYFAIGQAVGAFRLQDFRSALRR
jgi:putative peptidoglycan lipid II flippase